MSGARVTILAAMCLLGGCGPGAGGGVAWDDPAGDAKPPSNLPDRPRLDIVRVEARGADGALRLKVQLKDSLERHFAYTRPDGTNLAGVIAHFYLDTDNKAETGGHPTWSQDAGRPFRGYDHRVTLQLGYRYGNDASSMGFAAGDAVIETKKYKMVQPLAVYGIAKLRQGTDSIEFVRLPEGSRETILKSTSWKGDTVEAAVPYAWLGLKAGDTIRLCFYEREAGTAPDKGYSEDRVLKLGP